MIKDIVEGLKAIKDIIVVIKNEAEALEKIKKDNVGKVITFAQSLHVISEAIDNILDVVIDENDEVVSLDVTSINTLKHKIEELSKYLIKYKEWCDNMENGSCCLKCKTKILNRPTKMDEDINKKIDDCADINEKMISLQDSTVGSASKIKNRIMKKIWVHGLGKNQLNDTQLDIDTLATNLFTLLIKEEGEIKNKELYQEIIYSFLKSIDSVSITPPDGVIQINEINLYLDTKKINKDVKLKELLGVNIKSQQENIITEIPIDFNGMKINHKENLEFEKKDERYGSGFANKKAFSFKVPTSSENKEIISIIIECNACDQGWGGTGHAQIRYKINDGVTEPCINIWRDRVADGNYKMNISNNIKVDDEISVWLYCPQWSGWECKLNSAKVSIIWG